MQNGSGVRRKCHECSTGKHRCFVCKEDTNEVIKCCEKKCGKFYHLKCLQDQNYPHKIVNQKENKFKCPLHFCLTCFQEHQEDCVVRTVKKKLVTCVKCPTAYHVLNECIAAGSYYLDGSSYFVCPEHPENVKDSHGKPVKPMNVSWCFSCNFGGDLICCEKCPTAKHRNCIIEDEGQEPGEDGYYCSNCRARNQLHYGDIVWVKLASFRWWPARILATHNVPDNILNLHHLDGDFPVYFFGTKDYFWVNRSKAFLYMDGDDQKKISSHGKHLDKRFKQAMEEVAEAYKQWQKEKEEALQSKTVNPAPYLHLKVNKPYGNVQQPYVEMDIKSGKQICECKEEDPCTSDDCINRLLFYECDSTICNIPDCKNQRFKRREYAKIEKFKSRAGWGLRCTEDIKKNQFVIEYVGELIDENECNKRLKEMAARNDRNFYFLTIDKDTIIDAGPKGNLARFMNHSCQPNCVTQKWVVNNQYRVGLFATCDIAAGTELTFNYNLECRGDEKTKCLCNSENCSGFIGERPSKSSRKKEEKQKEIKKRKIKPDFSALHDDECFRCGEVGKLVMCDKRNCPKSYHLACLNLEKPPHGKWNCPVHHCDDCGKPAVKFCNHCPTSFCKDHQNNEMKTLPNGDLICNDHSAAYLKNARRKSKLAANSATPTASASTPTASASTPKAVSSSKKSPPKVKPNINDERMKEINEHRKKEEERRRSNIHSRNMRMMKRQSTDTPTGTPAKKAKVRDGDVSETDRLDSHVEKEEAMIVDGEFSSSNTSDSQTSNAAKTGGRSAGDVPMSNGLQSEQRGEETTKEKIVQDDMNNNNHNLSEKRPESVGISSSPASSVGKSISQKENRIDMEVEPPQTVGKILSDELLFDEESNESNLLEQTASQSNGTSQHNGTASVQQNGKRLEPPTNDASHLSNNDENKNYNKNHKLTTVIGSNGISEISEPAS